MMATPIEQLELMKNLAPNWDGYNADSLNHEVLEVAKEFVRILAAARPADPFRDVFVAPGRAGGVLIEWADDLAEHELEIEPDGSWGFLHIDRLSGRMTERNFKPVRHAVHPGILQELRELMAA